MFSNIGKKIKIIAEIFCWLGIAISVISGFTFIFEHNNDETSGFLIGFIIVILGSLSSCIGSFFAYGFGEIIERVISIDNKTLANNKSQNKRISKTGIFENHEDQQYYNMIDKMIPCKICGADISNDKDKCHVCNADLSHI